MLGRELEDLKAGVLQLECPVMTLSNGDVVNPKRYTGPGEIRFDEDSQLVLVIYDQTHQVNPQSLFPAGGSGTWLAESEIFDLRASDLRLRDWSAQNLRPDVSAHMSRPGAVVRARMQTLTCEWAPDREGKDWTWLYFSERIETPANVSTVTTIQESDEESVRRGFERNVWALPCEGLNLRLRRGDSGFEINAVADPGPIDPRLDTRLEEALWFTLGQPLTADVVQYRRGKAAGLHIRSRARKELVRSSMAPYSLQYIDAARHLGEIFCRYLKYVAGDEQPRFHPLSVLLRKALRSQDGTIEEAALALCVSIEGVLHLGFAKLGAAESDIMAAVATLEALVAEHLESSPIRERVLGFFSAVRRSSARSSLRSLRENGSVTQEEFDAWERLRHVAAHGQEYDMPFRTVYELTQHLRVLLCRLVLNLIGYAGPYTDYGAPGWPTRGVDDTSLAAS